MAARPEPQLFLTIQAPVAFRLGGEVRPREAVVPSDDAHLVIRQHLGVVGRLAVEVGARCGVPRAPPRHIIRDRVVGVERHVHDARFP